VMEATELTWVDRIILRGRAQGLRQAVLRILTNRYGALPPSISAGLDRINDLRRLETLLDVALAAGAVDEFERALQEAQDKPQRLIDRLMSLPETEWTWADRLYVQGYKEGRVLGLREAARETLHARFGRVAPDVESRLSGIDDEAGLSAFIERMHDVEAEADLL